MESIFWLLLLIIIIAGLIAVSILFSRRYARFRANICAKLKDSREQLFQRWEDLSIYNKVYLESFSDQDAGQYGVRAQEFQRNCGKAQDGILAGLQDQIRIKRTIPTWEKVSLKYKLGAIDRMQKWWQANREVDQLQLNVKGMETQVRDVERSLRALKDLPLEAANLARTSRRLCRETADLLVDLSDEAGVRGKTIEESLQSVRETEGELEKVPAAFYDTPLEDFASLPDVKSETLQALLVLEPASENLARLNQQAKEWKTKADELGKTAGILEDRVRETEALFNRLNKPLILSGEQEELSTLSQKADEVKASLAELTVEKLDPTFDDVKRTLVGLAMLTQTLREYDARLRKFQDLAAKVNGQLQAVEGRMKSAAARQDYPLLWTNSQTALEDAKENLASMSPLSERRTPAELTTHMETAESCGLSLGRLQEGTEKVVADLEQLGKLWVDLRPAYTNEWLTGVEQLFSEIKRYDLENNWEAADQASTLYIDADSLLKRANENIPAAASIPIYEQQVGPRLLMARDLVEKKPVFDARKARVETRLRQMQDEEKEATGIHRRIAPVVILFAKEIRSINISTKPAQNMLSADVRRVELESSLDQRNKGNVTKKLEAVQKWERNTADNGAQVYRWVEEDLLKRQVSVSASLKEIETFAEDLEDDIVVQAHKFDLVFAPNYLDAELLRKQSLDAIQNDAVKLFGEWQDVVECQAELRRFIAPVREEYDQMHANLKRLQESCSQLETRLDRSWPVVFQTSGYLRSKIDNLEKDIDGIGKLKWKRNDLQKRYYFLGQRLRDLGSEAAHLTQLDEQDAAGMEVLEKEYKNAVREYARRMYAGNETSIRKEIAAGDAFLSSLAEQYRSGRKNGTNDPSAVEVKARLQRKLETCKQQLADYNIARMDNALSERERKKQFMPSGKDLPVPLNKNEFINNLLRLIMDLEKITNQHPDIDEAVDDLRSAHREALKNRPDSLEIKRFLRSAKGTLVDVERTVPEATSVLDGLSMLTGIVKNIFG
jgi:hypothetical protein